MKMRTRFLKTWLTLTTFISSDQTFLTKYLN